MKSKLISVCLALTLILACVPAYAADMLIAPNPLIAPNEVIAPAPEVMPLIPTDLVLPGISDILYIDGAYFITDYNNNLVYLLDDDGLFTVAGTAVEAAVPGKQLGGYKDADLLESEFMGPWAIVPFLDGFAVSDTESTNVRYIGVDGVQTVNAGYYTHPTGLATDGENLFVADSAVGTISKVAPDGKCKEIAKGLISPAGMCYYEDALYVCETGKNRIVKVSMDGTVTPFAGKVTTDEDGYVGGFVDAAADKAEFDGPQNIIVDGGVFYVADSGNGAVRSIENGRVYTIISAKNGTEMVIPRAMIVTGGVLYAFDKATGFYETAVVATKQFTDVSSGYALKKYIDEAAKRGIVYGETDTRFNPKGSITRASFVTMLSRLAMNADGGLVISGDATFKDVPDTYWCKDAVSWAVDAGYLYGEDGKFNGSKSITREQAVAMLYRYAKAAGYDVSVGEDTNILDYDDAQKISSYAVPAFQWACGAGIVSGYADGTLGPKKTITRAEAAAMFVRMGN